jgi:hypothetical protein
VISVGYEVEMDFYRDWANMLKRQLESMGYTIDQALSFDEICVKFYGLFQRLIDPRPRKVKISKEFTCPAEDEVGLNLLIEKIEKGADLTPHLSKRKEDLNYSDPLLNDWGIYHLHLGTMINKSGFVNRTGPLLFALFTEDTAYLINVYGHSPQPWSLQDMIKIIDSNWPHITGQFKLKGVKPEREVTDEEYAQLRAAGVQVISVAGMAMAPMGGGTTTARTSVAVRTLCDDIAAQMRAHMQWIWEHLDEIVQKIRSKSDYRGNRFCFTLTRTQTGQIEISETNSGVLVANTMRVLQN